MPTVPTATARAALPARLPPRRLPPGWAPTSRGGVVLHELQRLAGDGWQALRRPWAGGDGALGRDVRLLLGDVDYRAQLVGRASTQFAQGLGSGAQTLLLSMTTSLTMQQGLLVNSLINAAELLLAQGAGMARALLSDKARNGLHGAAPAPAQRPASRAQLVSRLLLAAGYEACIAGCVVGLLVFRSARALAGRRILLALAAIRLARIFCMASQWASFDGLKGQLTDPAARQVVQRRWDLARTCEQGLGQVLHQAAGISCQLVPYVIACPSMTLAMGCMMGASIAVSLAAKLQLRGYLDEGVARPTPRQGAR